MQLTYVIHELRPAIRSRARERQVARLAALRRIPANVIMSSHRYISVSCVRSGDILTMSYRVSQEEMSIFWEVIVLVILSKQLYAYVHVSYSEWFPR
jgi:hypothetical protein